MKRFTKNRKKVPFSEGHYNYFTHNHHIIRGEKVLKNIKANLPKIDEVATRIAVETELEKALFIKVTGFDFERKEATITASYTATESQRSLVTSDQTARVALDNVESEEALKRQLWRVERAVSKLNHKQRMLINERYLTEFGVQDQYVYHSVMGISWPSYNRIRSEAFYILAFTLRVYVEAGTEGNGHIE